MLSDKSSVVKCGTCSLSWLVQEQDPVILALKSWVGCILGSTVCLQQGAARVIFSTLLCPIWRHPGLKWSHTRLFLLCRAKHNVHSGYGQVLSSFPLVCHHNDSESVTVHHHPLTLHFFEPGSAALFVKLLASGPSITASEIPTAGSQRGREGDFCYVS